MTAVSIMMRGSVRSSARCTQANDLFICFIGVLRCTQGYFTYVTAFSSMAEGNKGSMHAYGREPPAEFGTECYNVSNAQGYFLVV